MDFPMEQTSEKEKMMGWISRVAEREGEDAWEAVLWILSTFMPKCPNTSSIIQLA